MSKKQEKNPKLTMALVKKNVESFKKMRKVIFKDGTQVEIYEKFKPSKIDMLVDDIINAYREASEKEIDLDGINTLDLIMFYVIKHFSTFNPPKGIENEMKAFKVLVESEYYEQLCDEFDDEEISKVFKRINDILLLQDMYRREQEKLHKEISNMELENEEVREILEAEAIGDK